MKTFAALSLVVLLASVTLFGQGESPVAGVGNFLHIVADLDRSLAFYHDTLGLELSGPAGEHNFVDNPAVANLYGVPGKQFRAAVLKIPGTSMGIELVQWGKPLEPNIQSVADPGAVTLILHRTTGAAAALRDPDGFPVELERSEIASADLRISVRNVRETAALYTSVLGFKPDGDWLRVPGSSVRIRLTEARGTEGLTIPFPAPGRGMLRLMVRGIAPLSQSLKDAGFSIITQGGAPVVLPQGPRVIIVRDPNNFYFQAMETR
jgi:catechol 2,3-dioxygenase-like lactoylglutathione lyase family enzyme